MMKDKNAKKAGTGTERDPNAKKIIATNRRARHEYEIEETYDVGMVLVGTEVKSLRAGRLNFVDSFCRIEHNEMWLYNLNILHYIQGNQFNVEQKRKRKLLLHKHQILELQAKSEQKGLTIVPLSLYFQRGFAKMEIALGKGKKLYDKRDSIAERDQERETRRQFVGRDHSERD